MADLMNGADFVALIRAIYRAVEAAKPELNALDSALGDGDHGSALAAAFADAAEKVPTLADPTPAAVMQAASQSLLNRMGGASGALYGTLFGRMSRAFEGQTQVGMAEWQAALGAGLEGVQARGKSAPGDKTMVDALYPAVTAFRREDNLGSAFSGAAAAAQAGAEQTAPMVAKFGRAKFVGERAIGHIDAGARSMAVLFAALDAFWKGQQHGEA